MRSKPISFAQVLKSKGRTESFPHSNSRLSLSQLMDQFENCPEEDYTLYLGAFSRGKPSSFRGIVSKTGSGEGEIFDSWIQKQSLVSNKENMRPKGSKNILQVQKQQKKIMLTSRGRQNRQPLKSVAELVHKMELSESATPTYFKSNGRSRLQKSQEKAQTNALRNFNNKNQQSSLKGSNQYEINISMPAGLPEKISAQPYIEHLTVTKPRRKECIEDLVGQAEHIHVEIAQLAHKYMEDEQNGQEQREDSLLIDSPEQKIPQKDDFVPSFQMIEEDGEARWRTAKNQLANYLLRIKQESKQVQTNQGLQQNRAEDCGSSHPGYSFAEEQNMLNYQIPLDIINIPKIQEIQSERLPFENYQYSLPIHIQTTQNIPAPQNPCIPSTESVKYESTAQQEREEQSPEVGLSAKGRNCSLALSPNLKDTPSPQVKQQQEENRYSSGQQQVTLSFTEEKPEIVVNIPLNYANEVERTDQFQIQPLRARQECLEGPFASSSPSKNRYEQVKEKSIKMAELQSEEKFSLEEKARTEEKWFIRECEGEAIKSQKQKDFNVLYEDIKNRPLINQIPQLNGVSLKPQVEEDPQGNDELIVFPQRQEAIPSWMTPSDIQQPTPPTQTHHQLKSSQEVQPKVEQIKPQSITINEPSPQIHNVRPVQVPLEIKRSNNKGSHSKGSAKGSPSVFGLKKIYSSPNSMPMITSPPVVTSAFTAIDHKGTKNESFEHKGYIGGKSYEKHAKIESLAYISSYAKKKEDPNKFLVQEEKEEFQFDF